MNVRRFHQHTTHEVDTVGKHSCGVALMVFLIDPTASREVILSAMCHDLGEYITGDIPAPTKRMISGSAARELAAVESEVLKEHGFDFKDDLSATDYILLKLGDYFDGLAFCIEEAERGNLGLIEVARTYIRYIPDFMQHTVGLPWERNAQEIYNYLYGQFRRFYNAV